MRAPYRVRQIFAKVLKEVQQYRVDVIAGDANAAAYNYHKRHDFYNSSVAVMLKETHREVNKEPPISEQTSYSLFDQQSPFSASFNRLS